MNDFARALRALAAGGGRGVLVTVEETAGSTPRKAGARMLLGPDGAFSGTVGGGILEYRAQQDALRVRETGEALRREYSLGGGPGEDIGAICGGSAALSFAPIGAAEAEALLAQEPAPPRVWLYGAGHVGKALCDALALLGLDVTVTDDRAGLLTPERFPRAETCCAPPEMAPMAPAPGDMVVIMTHAHTHDYELLKRALQTDAGYIGLVASRRKAAAFRERLLAEGISPAALERLRSPVGLPIRAETPEEIAVSIAAELIEYLRT